MYQVEHDIVQRERVPDIQIISATIHIASIGQHATVISDDNEDLVLLGFFHGNKAGI